MSKEFFTEKVEESKPKTVLTLLAQEYRLTVEDVMKQCSLERDEIIVEGTE